MRESLLATSTVEFQNKFAFKFALSLESNFFKLARLGRIDGDIFKFGHKCRSRRLRIEQLAKKLVLYNGSTGTYWFQELWHDATSKRT